MAQTYEHLDEHFRNICTRNTVVAKDEQIKLYDYLMDRMNNNFNSKDDRQEPTLQQRKKNKRRKDNVQPTPKKKVIAVMDKDNETMLYFRVLTQSILSTGEISNFTKRAHLMSVYFCIDHGEMKQSYVSLTKLVREIYPKLLKNHNEDLSKEYEELVGLYILFLVVHSDEDDHTIVSFLRYRSKLMKIESVQFALKVLHSIKQSNYFQFFQLFNMSTGRTQILMRTYLNEMRVTAFRYIQKAYYSIPLSFVADLLRFENGKDFLEWLHAEVAEREKKNKDKMNVVQIDIRDMEVIEEGQTIVFRRPTNKAIIR